MSRFYKTSQPTFVDDVMFKLPFEEIAGTLASKDAGIDQQYEDIAEFKKSLNTDNLSEDDPAINGAIRGYRDQIAQAEQDLSADYANYERIVPRIKGISAKLEADVYGKFKAAKENKDTFDKEKAKIEKMDIDPEVKEGYLREVREKYAEGGALNYNDDTNSYTRIDEHMRQLAEKFDETAYLSKVAAGYKSDRRASTGYRDKPGNDDYFELTGYSKEFIDPADVRKYLEADIDNTQWAAARRDELRYKNGIKDEATLEQALAVEKEELIQMGVNKIAFSQTDSRRSVQAKAGAGREKKDSDTAEFRDVQVNARPGIVDAKTAENLPTFGKSKNNVAETKARYDKGFNLIKNQIWGDENMQALTTDQGRKQIMAEGAKYTEALNSLPATDVHSVNTALKSHPTYSALKNYADGTETNISTKDVIGVLNLTANQYDLGEAAITGAGHGTIATYDSKGSFSDALKMAAGYAQESGIVTTVEGTTQQVVPGSELSLKGPQTETVKTKQQVQVDLPQGDVLAGLIKEGRAAIMVKEYGEVKQNQNGSRVLDNEREVVIRLNIDADKTVGNTEGQTVEFSIPASKFKK